MRQLREELPARFPGVTFSFLPADIISQILNFGAPAPIDLQVRGPDLKPITAMRRTCCAGCGMFPASPTRAFSRRSTAPLSTSMSTARARNMSASTSATSPTAWWSISPAASQVAPTYWLNPENGVNYAIVMQTPQYQIDSLSALQNLAITAAGAPPQTLSAIADITRVSVPAVYSQYNIMPMVQIYGTTQDRDLGAVAADVQKVMADAAPDAPKGVQAALLGQVRTMNSAFFGLLFGLLGAIVLIYLLIVVNFQSWGDPFVIITALPAALAGIVWTLFSTHTTLSVPALTGAIMCMGVATANSVLVVSFAREQLEKGAEPVAAAIEAGFVRFRPVLMTALAMIIGMAPMALGLGEGGEQNAPLGRAVVGGLIWATAATLLFVPVVFSMLHDRNRAATPANGEPHAA